MNRFLILLFKVSYFYYKLKYNIFDLKFNGYLIRINGSGKINVGDNSYISFYSTLNTEAGTIISIGSNVSIAHNVKIYTSTFLPSKFIANQGKKFRYGDVIIHDNTFIGTNTVILPGVEIGPNVVIGANSVVSKSIVKSGIYRVV